MLKFKLKLRLWLHLALISYINTSLIEDIGQVTKLHKALKEQGERRGNVTMFEHGDLVSKMFIRASDRARNRGYPMTKEELKALAKHLGYRAYRPPLPMFRGISLEEMDSGEHAGLMPKVNDPLYDLIRQEEFVQGISLERFDEVISFG